MRRRGGGRRRFRIGDTAGRDHSQCRAVTEAETAPTNPPHCASAVESIEAPAVAERRATALAAAADGNGHDIPTGSEPADGDGGSGKQAGKADTETGNVRFPALRRPSVVRRLRPMSSNILYRVESGPSVRCSSRETSSPEMPPRQTIRGYTADDLFRCYVDGVAREMGVVPCRL